MKVSYERLVEVLDYNPDTGAFMRKISTGPKAIVGEQAGSIDNQGYVRIGVDGVVYPAHRLAWLYSFKEWPIHNIDHINQLRHDNRIVNLRDVPQSENMKNTAKNINNKSGVLGVHCRKNGKWRASIRGGGRLVYLGTHADFNAAVITRKVAEFAYNYHENHGK